MVACVVVNPGQQCGDGVVVHPVAPECEENVICLRVGAAVGLSGEPVFRREPVLVQVVRKVVSGHELLSRNVVRNDSVNEGRNLEIVGYVLRELVIIRQCHRQFSLLVRLVEIRSRGEVDQDEVVAECPDCQGFSLYEIALRLSALELAGRLVPDLVEDVVAVGDGVVGGGPYSGNYALDPVRRVGVAGDILVVKIVLVSGIPFMRVSQSLRHSVGQLASVQGCGGKLQIDSVQCGTVTVSLREQVVLAHSVGRLDVQPFAGCGPECQES